MKCSDTRVDILRLLFWLPHLSVVWHWAGDMHILLKSSFIIYKMVMKRVLTYLTVLLWASKNIKHMRFLAWSLEHSLLFHKYLFVIIFIVTIASHSSPYVALIGFPKHVVFSIHSRSISERPDSFIRGGAEVTDTRRCMRNWQEGAREEVVWDPGWMPGDRNFYPETSL